MRVGLGETISRHLAELGRPLLSREGIVRADAFVVGAAGAGRDTERFELQTALERERLAWRVLVTSDAELARAAAFEGGPGVLLIAGTGSIALSRDADGTLRRVGGLGWRMGDQGSGYWLASRALEAVGAMHDQLGPVTRLAETLPAAVKAPGIAALVRWSTTATPAAVAALGPHVVECAEHGDPVALDLVNASIAWLSRLAIAAGGRHLPVALAGGLLSPGRPLRPLLVQLLISDGVKVETAAIDPCRGAPVLVGTLGSH
jgi:glucosamine kinase